MGDQVEKHSVLVVDDTPENIDVIAGVLKPRYRVRAATSGKRALEIARSDSKTGYDIARYYDA